MPGQKKAVRYCVSGLVQGVGYRYFALRVAQKLGIAGYVRNLSDGSVEVYAVGADDTLRLLRQDLQKGPPGAVVEEVAETAAGILQNFASDFSIEHDR